MTFRFPTPGIAAACLLSLSPSAAIAASKADRAAGAALYHSSGCEHCHGANLAGTEEGVSLQGVGKTMSRDDITHQIVKGGGGMPAFREALNDDQIARLVDFLESHKKVPKKTKPGTPNTAPAPTPKSDDSGQ